MAGQRTLNPFISVRLAASQPIKMIVITSDNKVCDKKLSFIKSIARKMQNKDLCTQTLEAFKIQVKEISKYPEEVLLTLDQMVDKK